MKRIALSYNFLTLVLMLAYVQVSAQYKNGEESISSLISAEKDFQQKQTDKGQREGYLEVMRQNTILFKPDAVNGPEYISQKKSFKGGMFWSPVWAEMSRDGYFGYTTGPYKYLLNDTTYHGEYVSIWLRGPYQPVWKLFLDAGISHGKPSGQLPVLSFPDAVSTFSPDTNIVKVEISRLFPVSINKFALAVGESHITGITNIGCRSAGALTTLSCFKIG